MLALWMALSFCFCLSVANGQSSNSVIQLALPAFSMELHVKNIDVSLVEFQDRLEDAVRKHLVNFFSVRINTEDFDYGTVEDVTISAQLFWREIMEKKQEQQQQQQYLTNDEEEDDLSLTNDVEDLNNEPARDISSDGQRKYEVRSSFECQLQLNNMDVVIAATRLNPSMVGLLLLEAFEGNNYWHLYHLFFSDTQLSQIDDVQISVMTNDGFKPQSGINNSNDGDSFDGSRGKHGSSSLTFGGWTMSMTIGIAFASFFLFVLVVMWTYLLLFVRGTCVLKVGGGGGTGKNHLSKDGSVTDPENLSDFDDETIIDPNQQHHHQQQQQEADESAWMDEWAIQITSIPLRQPTKSKKKSLKKKHRCGVRRPSQQHMSHLFQISESDADDSSCCTSEFRPDEEFDDEMQDVNLTSEPTHPSGEGPDSTGCTTLIVYQSREMVEHPTGTRYPGRYEYRISV